MNAQQLRQQRTARAFHNSVEPEDFVPQHLTRKALSEDSCWEEYEADYDEVLPSCDLSFLDDIACN